MDRAAWTGLSGLLQRQGRDPTEETRIPCRSLRASQEIGVVFPSAWEGFCRRRTSWYWNSGKAGKVLLVSNRALDLSEIVTGVVMTESNFRPDRLPDAEEINQLIQSEIFRRRKPPLWDKIDPAERDVYQRWFERYGAKEPFDFEDIFKHHSANHANFVDPRFFVTQKTARAPYSIADSLHACSSCLEFFDILGEPWSLKYVVPCLGAVQFARLPRDLYFEIDTCKG
jgi:hypothetical protein